VSAGKWKESRKFYEKKLSGKLHLRLVK